MRTISSICLTAAFLTACSTPAQRAAQKSAEDEQMLTIYGPACARLGYAARTDPWRSCIVQMHQTDGLRHSYGYLPADRGYYGGPYY